MHIVDKNYIALFDYGIKLLVTYQLYILDPRFVPRLMRDLIPLSTDELLPNNWPMTDQYCAISYQFFWLESLFLVIFDC